MEKAKIKEEKYDYYKPHQLPQLHFLGLNHSLPL